MTKNDLREFCEVWASAYGVYGRDVNDAMFEIVFAALMDYSIEDIRRGLSAHIKNPDTGQYPPKPADVVKHISGNSQSSGGEAWAKVDHAIRCVGNYRSVVFDDPKIHAAIERLGGWIKISMTSNDEYPYLQNNFLKLYQGFTIKPPVSYPRHLIGTNEHQNSLSSGFQRGNAMDEPVMIGDPEKAKMVYEGGTKQGVAQITHGGPKNHLELVVDRTVKRLEADS